jgi:hypothetical protein
MSARAKSQTYSASKEKNTNLSLPKEEINMEELQKKFQIAKEERKKAQKEEEILKQRVNHLHNQEKTVMSKVENTKKTLTNIVENKQFIKDQERIRAESAKRKEKDLQNLKENVKSKKTQLKETLSQSRTLKDIKSMNTNITNKEEQKQNKKIQILNKLEDILKNATLHQSVRAMEMLIEEKRKRETLERKIKIKEELLLKLEKEEITKKFLDNELLNLGKEEDEIVQNFNNNEHLEELKSKKKVNIARNNK